MTSLTVTMMLVTDVGDKFQMLVTVSTKSLMESFCHQNLKTFTIIQSPKLPSLGVTVRPTFEVQLRFDGIPSV